MVTTVEECQASQFEPISKRLCTADPHFTCRDADAGNRDSTRLKRQYGCLALGENRSMSSTVARVMNSKRCKGAVRN